MGENAHSFGSCICRVSPIGVRKNRKLRESSLSIKSSCVGITGKTVEILISYLLPSGFRKVRNSRQYIITAHSREKANHPADIRFANLYLLARWMSITRTSDMLDTHVLRDDDALDSERLMPAVVEAKINLTMDWPIVGETNWTQGADLITNYTIPNSTAELLSRETFQGEMIYRIRILCMPTCKLLNWGLGRVHSNETCLATFKIKMLAFMDVTCVLCVQHTYVILRDFSTANITGAYRLQLTAKSWHSKLPACSQSKLSS